MGVVCAPTCYMYPRTIAETVGDPGLNADTISAALTAPVAPAVLTLALTITDSLSLTNPTPDEVVITIIEYHIYLPLVMQQ